MARTMSVSQQNRDRFIALSGSARAEMSSLDAYADLLVRWQARINLISSATLEDLWERHFLDSAQLYAHIPPGAGALYDIGSGGGFPGLVLAVMSAARGGPAVSLIESDTRKATFLREASRISGAGAQILDQRAESITAPPADVVTARACAPLPRLLPWVHGRLKPGGTALLLKGAQWRDELTAAEKDWTMRVAEIPSLTDTSGVILKPEGLNPN